ncbi:hypothetical protein BCR34DRAFT_599763 [Clohesyomyces aquaticus]|uniref:Mid2 domain-containing protein n=1 Tax=Clohesyomyces aquaticus TaxID=1231657 RepID=A0A1Y1ZTQ9_9PLEO|nr:hypothetical protein BCR34DRAFT_599763 [Clohesyomyces aquaticus]
MTITLILLLATLCASSLAQFLYPGPFGKNNDYVTGVPEWQEGSIQTLKWETNLTYYAITLWQQNLDGSSAEAGYDVYKKIASAPEIGNSSGYPWTVNTTGFDLKTSNVFWLNLRAGDEKGNRKSSYFNVSAAAMATTTMSSLSTTSTASSTSSPSSTSPVLVQNNNNTIKIALGVGLGVSIPIIALSAAAVWLVHGYIQRRRPDELPKSGFAAEWVPEPKVQPEVYRGAEVVEASPAELDAVSSPQELNALR